MTNLARPRLCDVQHLLCELVETLDAKRVRHVQDLDRAWPEMLARCADFHAGLRRTSLAEA